MDSPSLDITEHTEALAEAMGVPYHDVASFVIEPNRITAYVYERNERGHFFVDPDTGKAPVREVARDVRA